MKISVKQAYKTLRQKGERGQPKKAEAKKVGCEEREEQEESARRGTESTDVRAATGVSTIVLKTPGWNSKDVAESLSPSPSPPRRGAYLFRYEARSGTHERAALPPPSKSSDVARRAHAVIVVAETKLSLHRALPLPLPRQLYVGVLLERS